jgi:hypothetical protein
MRRSIHTRALLSLAVAVGATSAATALAASSPSAAATHLAATFVVRGGDVKDYEPAGSATRFTTAAAWGGKKSALTARLEQEGFVAAASEYTLYTPKGGTGGGISWALELGSAGDASRELAADYKQLAVSSMGASVVKRYSLPGIRSSRAWTTQALGFAAANVLYSEGRCVLLIGIERTIGGSLANVMAPLQTAAQTIYRRTHRTCP